MLKKLFSGFTIEALLLVIALLIYVLIRQTRRARHTTKGEPVVRLEGVVTEIMPDGSYWVENVVEHNKHSIKCHISRKCKSCVKQSSPTIVLALRYHPMILLKVGSLNVFSI